MGSVSFSVLICTYNRPQLLAQCLAALVERTTEKPDQIVVVNGGDERADQLVQRTAEQSPVHFDLVKTQNKNLAASRNVGLPHCTGDIVAMTDDDAEVFPEWVTQMKRVHAEHPEAGAAGGPVIGAASDSLISRIADQVTFNSPATARTVLPLRRVVVSYKRCVIEQVGMQDERLFRGEDVDYNWRAKQLGYEIYYDPAVGVLHHHRPDSCAGCSTSTTCTAAPIISFGKWPEDVLRISACAATAKGFLKSGKFFRRDYLYAGDIRGAHEAPHR